MSVFVVLTALVIGSLLAFHPRLRDSTGWRATVTPLASIMGSGFLVSAPLLVGLTGLWAPVAMAALLAVAYGVGAVIRFNIRFAEPLFDEQNGNAGPSAKREHRNYHGHQHRCRGSWAATLEEVELSAATRFEQASHLVLVAAYLVSVTYYLQLLGVFVISRVPEALQAHLPPSTPKLLTTAVLLTIAGVGWWKGLGALEGIERYAVALNFGMIAALIAALAIYGARLAASGSWSLPPLEPSSHPVRALRSMMGLLIIVQGFETSRFLGSEHSAEERVASMRWAQLISAAIYLAFIALALVLFKGDERGPVDVTAIVHLVSPVAAALPPLIVIVAAASQFSAAVADDAGCAGLANVLFGQRLTARDAYPLIGAATIALTWGTDVLQIISIASRAFAVFYTLQCGVALATALDRPDGERRLGFVVLCAVLGLVCAAVAVFGLPAE